MLYSPSIAISTCRYSRRTRDSSSSSACQSLCAKLSRFAPLSCAPCTMLLCASESWTTRSPGPNSAPITVTFVAWPLTNATQSSVS